MSWRRRMGERAPVDRRKPLDPDNATTQTQPALTDEEIMRQDPEGVFRRLREGGDGGKGRAA